MAHFRKGKTAGSATTDSCRCEKIQKNLEVAQNKLKKTFAKLDKLKKAAVKKVAKKVATLPLKAVPILGWAMAAYDVYDVVTTGIDIAEVVEQFNKEAAIVNKLHKKLDACLGKKRKMPKKLKCFEPKEQLLKNARDPKKLEKEFYRQLKDQESGINNMSIGKYLENRQILKDLTAKHGHEKARRILTRGGKAQEAARKELKSKIEKSVESSLEKKGIVGKKAQDIIDQKAKEQLDQLAALHDPDLIAGGSDKIARVGDKRVNSSIGSQWAKEGRVEAMDKAAKERLKTHGADAKMDIKLERCK